jgi:beta-glucanase (GH16 family)
MWDRRNVWRGSTVLGLVCALASGLASGGGSPPASAATVIMWSGFDGSALGTNWKPVDAKGCTSLSNITVSGGQLHLRVGQVDNHPYCGARIQSTKTFRYGVKIEVRARADLPYGTHEGVTLFGTKGSWPWAGEIDVAEMLGRTPFVDHVRLWSQRAGATDPTRCGLARDYTNPTTLDGAWHTYGIRWTGTGVTFLFDGRSLYTLTYSALKAAGCLNPFADSTNPFRIDLGAFAGGSWVGSPVGQPGYPASYDVDFVRVTAL